MFLNIMDLLERRRFVVYNASFSTNIPYELDVFQDLDQRLKDLVNYDRVMLFMKGSPAEPRCGEES